MLQNQMSVPSRSSHSVLLGDRLELLLTGMKFRIKLSWFGLCFQKKKCFPKEMWHFAYSKGWQVTAGYHWLLIKFKTFKFWETNCYIILRDFHFLLHSPTFSIPWHLNVMWVNRAVLMYNEQNPLLIMRHRVSTAFSEKTIKTMS